MHQFWHRTGPVSPALHYYDDLIKYFHFDDCAAGTTQIQCLGPLHGCQYQSK